MSAREEVLRRVREALRDVPPRDGVTDLPRGYAAARSYDDVPALFLERVADYKAVVHRVAAGAVRGAVEEAMGRRGARRVVVPPGLPQEWRPALAEVEVVEDDGTLSHADLDGLDGVISGCATGIAETGTIVLDGGPASGRRAVTLLPDYHLCVVRVDQVVASLPEGLARLDGTRPLTFVSGPSATSDIELERVEGVHGPRTLEVLLVG